MENDTNQIHCEDELQLQRLLDQELDADAAELVFHHLQGCHRCAALFQELKESKALCEERLGLEDEFEVSFSTAALTRVGHAIKSSIKAPVAGNGHERALGHAGESPTIATVAVNKTIKARSWWESINFGSLLQPRVATAIVAILLVAALLVWLRTPAPVSAAELLAKSTAADEAIATHAGQVLRRTISLQTRVSQSISFPETAQTVLTRRIEIWQAADKGLAARRLFDEKNHLLAGEWRKADGSRVIYHEGDQPQIQPTVDRPPQTLLSPGNVWLLDVSAKDFTSLVENVNSAQVYQTEGAYVINYSAPNAAARAGLVKAVLVLSKADLHTIEQTLVVNSATDRSQFIQYKFSETSFERRTPNSVAPAVFEPDPAVLATVKGKRERAALTAEPAPLTNAPATIPATSAASAELEVEVLEKLNRVSALQGEQLSLTRADGKLLITGIVETSERKNEILRALGDVTQHPAVRIDLNTVAEAQQRQKRAQPNITIENVEVSQNTLPVDAELRGFFSRRGLSGEQIESEIEQFSRRVLSHSARARSHALALKQVAERFSPAEIEAMDANARTRWRALITEHAKLFRRELQEVRQALAPMFPSADAGGGNAGLNIGSDQDLAPAGKQLFELAASADNGLRRSLSLSAERTDAPLRSAQFWNSFKDAEALAEKISKQ